MQRLLRVLFITGAVVWCQPSFAVDGSSPNWATDYLPTAAEWNALWASKADSSSAVLGPASSLTNDCVKFTDTTGLLVADVGMPCGTVNSVGLILPGIFSVTGSPVTGSGNLTVTLASQAAHRFFAAPTGSSGEPSFRAISGSDLPAQFPVFINSYANSAAATHATTAADCGNILSFDVSVTVTATDGANGCHITLIASIGVQITFAGPVTNVAGQYTTRAGGYTVTYLDGFADPNTGTLGWTLSGDGLTTVFNVLDGTFGSGQGNAWSPACSSNCATVAGALAGANLASTERLATLYGFHAGGAANSTSGNGTELAAFGWNAAGNITGTNQYLIAAFGTNVLGSCTTGCTSDTVIGIDAGRDLLILTSSVLIGQMTGNSASCSQCVLIGNGVMQGNLGSLVTTGGNSVGVGHGVFGSTGITASFHNNTAVGEAAGNAATSMSGAALFGLSSGNHLTDGNFNSCFGFQSCLAEIHGGFNVMVGANAGLLVLSSNTTILGTTVGSTTLVSGTNVLLAGTNSSCDTPTSSTSNYIGLCAGSTPIFAATGTGTPATAIAALSGALQIGSLTALTVAGGEFGMVKTTASGTAPGAAGVKLAAVCGTNAGTAKLIMSAGTSGTAATVLDNVGAGVTGC